MSWQRRCGAHPAQTAMGYFELSKNAPSEITIESRPARTACNRGVLLPLAPFCCCCCLLLQQLILLLLVCICISRTAHRTAQSQTLLPACRA